MYAEVGLQVARVVRPDGRAMVLFTFRHDGPVPTERRDQERFLTERLAGAGWEVPTLLAALPQARTLYLDGVSQVRMPSWSSGRTALVGDAAACLSLLAGQGSALAMVEAYVLAAELDRCGGDHGAAFAAYEGRLRKLVSDKQTAAEGLGLVFAPRNRRQLWLRNALMRMLGLPLVSDLAYGNLRDAIELPAPAGV
jgi:2-polyprenyl-6-methoxyphenol hydroxylase-like FAD-dependent oxidoreductase